MLTELQQKRSLMIILFTVEEVALKGSFFYLKVPYGEEKILKALALRGYSCLSHIEVKKDSGWVISPDGKTSSIISINDLEYIDDETLHVYYDKYTDPESGSGGGYTIKLVDNATKCEFIEDEMRYDS